MAVPKGLIAIWCAAGFLLISVIIIYCVLRATIDSTVTDASRMCGKDALTYDYFHHPPKQTLEVWLYNISNTDAYVNHGTTATLDELGPFGFDLDINREQVSFADDKVQFVLWNILTVSFFFAFYVILRFV